MANADRPALLQLSACRLTLGRQRHFGPFDLALRPGERVALLGPSGAGKSTLLRLISGEQRPHTGEALMEGRPLAGWSAVRRARRRAVLPQSHAVAFGLASELVVSLGRIAREPDPHLGRIVEDAMACAACVHLAGRRFDTLSGGEQARVQLARVFAQLWDERDALLLVDEPLSALDPGLQWGLMAALQAYVQSRGHALVAVLHDINQALAGFDRLWLLREGRLWRERRPDAEALPSLEALYGMRLLPVSPAGQRLAVLPAGPLANTDEPAR